MIITEIRITHFF